jgi:anti-sigma factor RsiW
MLCSEALLQISEYVDGRLPDPVAATLERHFAGCAACAQSVREQRALQQLARGLIADPRPLPTLQLDEAAPSVAPRGKLHFIGWRRVAAAAVFLALTHLVAFELGSDSSAVNASGMGNDAVAMEASFLPERLRDHTAAARLMAGQIALMPSEAGEEASQIVDRQLALLDTKALADSARRSEWARSGERRQVADRYFASWASLNDALRARLAEPGHTVAALQQALERSGFDDALCEMESHVAHVRAGVWYRTAEGAKELTAAFLAPRPLRLVDPASSDACQFLAAHAEMLRGNVQEAGRAFADLQGMQHLPGGMPHSSSLAGVARYMQARCLHTAGQAPVAFRVLANGHPLDLVRELKSWYSADPVLVSLVAAAEHVDRSGGLPLQLTPGSMRVIIAPRVGMVNWVSSGCRSCSGH